MVASRVLKSAVVASAALRAACTEIQPTPTKKEDGRGSVVQEMKIEAPVYTEEDQYGYNMPDLYKCDSCKAVMYHLDQGLRKKQPKSRRLKQWEYTDAFEDLCKTSFEGYGIKVVNGQNALSGPGIKHEELTPGMGAIQMGGDSWTKRMSEECKKIVFEKVGEEEMYDKFYAGFKKEEESSSAEMPDFGAVFRDSCFGELRYCKKPKEGPEAPAKEAGKKDKKAEKKAKDAQKKAKKEADAKKKDAKKADKKAEAKAVSSGDGVDVQTFLRQLALKHGLSAEEYVSKRSEKDWEKLMISMASKIFNKQSDEL